MTLIEVHLAELRQLFNPIDPSPPRERSLDARTEEFIVDRARLAPSSAHFSLHIEVDRRAEPGEEEWAIDAVHGFFKQRGSSASMRLSHLFRVGRKSLAIGLLFLATAVILAALFTRTFGTGTAATMMKESLVIGGWVAMWRPLEIFLYDWWPISAERRLFDRLSAMHLRITFGTDSRNHAIPSPPGGIRS